MRRRRVIILGVVTVVIFALAGCTQSRHPASSPAPATTAVTVAAPQAGGLPAPETLTDVLYRIADPAVAGSDKLDLVEDATAADATSLDRFATALRDNGYDPPTFAATDIAWSDARPEDVVATIVVSKPGDSGDGGSFPMEFAPYQGGWQLSQETLTMLLGLTGTQTGASPGPESGTEAVPEPTPTG